MTEKKNGGGQNQTEQPPDEQLTPAGEVDTRPVEQRGLSGIAQAQAEFAEKERERVKDLQPQPEYDPAAEEGEGGEFVLLSGDHTEDGVFYEYDRNSEVVVPSRYPLDQMFMNKFRRTDGPTHPGRDYNPPWERPGLVDSPMAERLPHGQATQFSVDTDKDAVAALAERRENEATQPEEQRMMKKGKVPKGKAAKAQSSRAEDVTDQFEGAKAAKVNVLKRGREYQVVEKGTKSVVNKKPITTKTDVESLLKELGE